MEENKTIDTAFEACEEETVSCAQEEEKCDAPKKEKKTKKDAEKKLLEEIENLKAEMKEKDDKYLRMAAEYDNFRRRSREEKDATYEIAAQDTIAELLPIIDNLERASLYDDGDKVKEGLVMIAKSVENVFSKLGVEEIGKVGDKFDPNLHNAVMHVDDEAYGENEITEVFQKGYRKGSRIIRFAMVKTAN